MNIDSIFNNGLDEVLCVIRDLPGYSPAKLKQEEFKIARYKIEYILFSFQDYIKSLPAPGVSLSASNRILIYNARCILEGISIVFNVQIDCIQRLYSNYLKYREKQLVSDPYNRADITKPRAKTGKTRKFPRISDVIETHDHEVPLTRDAPSDSSFFDEGAPALPSSVVDGAALFERDSLFVSSLGDAANIPEDLELRFAESLKDVSTHLPSVPVTNIAQPDALLPIDAEAHHVLDKFSLGLVEPTEDMDLSAAPRIVDKPTDDPLLRELEQIIDNIGVDLVEKTTRHKKVKKTFRDKPVMTSEEYAKFLDRKKSMDPLKYYAKSHQETSKGKEEKSILQVFLEFLDENPNVENLLKMATKEIPVPIIPTYLRHQSWNQTDPNEIPLFEFPILEQDFQHQQERRADEDVLREDLEGVSRIRPSTDSQHHEVHEGRRTDILREDLEEVSRIRPSTDFQLVDALRPPSEIDEIQNLSLLMTAMSLDYTPRISMPQPFEEGLLPSNLEEVKQTSFPRRPDENGRERVDTYGVPMSLDQVHVKITDLCAQLDTSVIRFIEICDLSKTKLEAATVFVHLIELWRHKLVELHQASPHPNNIFVTLSG
nr:uncharacterized protein LOC106677043 [Halyomorpha halys]